MARNSISNTIMDAANVTLQQPIKVHGINQYSISTNFISWGEGKSFQLSDIASTFGVKRPIMNSDGIEGSTTGFSCGSAAIRAFDFGLLYTVFNSMLMARVQSGISFPTEDDVIDSGKFRVLWLGSECIIYSVKLNVCIPFKGSFVEKVCAGSKVPVVNFCSREAYTVERDGRKFIITKDDGTFFLDFEIPQFIKRMYDYLFTSLEEGDGSEIIDDLATEWDEGSPLGRLISESDSRTAIRTVLAKYKEAPSINSVVSRNDLIVKPKEHYDDLETFFGSICYTDKEEIAVAVNFRSGLFVYYPWFSSNGAGGRTLCCDPTAQFSQFYNITDGCNQITRFAATINRRPLTPAELDIKMFLKIKTAFMNQDLPRTPIQSAFGRVVIPEDILIKELESGNGEGLFCLLPVGIIGSKLACISPSSELTSITPTSWQLDSAFYDVTEVISND